MKEFNVHNLNVSELIKCLQQYGYCYFNGYDINLIDNLFHTSINFFNKPKEFKYQYQWSNDGPFSKKYNKLGYADLGGETSAFNFQHQNIGLYDTINAQCEANEEFEASAPDLKESFNVHDMMFREDFPFEDNDYNIVKNGYHYLNSISQNILKYIENGLNIKKNVLRRNHTEGSILRLIKYPQLDTYEKNSYRISKHRDGTTFTLIFHYPDLYDDLERFDEKTKQWIPIPSKKNHFIMHIGWNLKKITHDFFPCIIHRVNNKNIDKDRYSVLYFFSPNN